MSFHAIKGIPVPKKSEFFDLVDFGDVAISVETVIPGCFQFHGIKGILVLQGGNDKMREKSK